MWRCWITFRTRGHKFGVEQLRQWTKRTYLNASVLIKENFCTLQFTIKIYAIILFLLWTYWRSPSKAINRQRKREIFASTQRNAEIKSLGERHFDHWTSYCYLKQEKVAANTLIICFALLNILGAWRPPMFPPAHHCLYSPWAKGKVPLHRLFYSVSDELYGIQSILHSELLLAS